MRGLALSVVNYLLPIFNHDFLCLFFTEHPNPDIFLTPPKIIRRHGYPAEAHIIESEDGYLLEYHRIPHGKLLKASTSKYPVFLHHGVACSSIDWIINGPEKSLGYRLADEGYDVWMANARGNTFSRSHVSLSPGDKQFWNFTFHEMGYYDIPAAIDYILNVTKKEKIIYIGHSLGTTAFYTFAITRPELSDKILGQVSLAPVAGIPHTTSVVRLFAPFAREIQSMTDWYTKGAFMEHDFLTTLFSKYICGRHVFNVNLCEQLLIFSVFGKDAQQFNESLIPLITSNIPAGTSSKTLIHCAQMISSGELRYYDYGTTLNLKEYDSPVPPIYNLSSISIPIKIYYGPNDILADPQDALNMYQKLSKPMGAKKIEFSKWNHVDFLWAIEVNKYFNNELIEFLRNLTTDSEFISTSVKKAIKEREERGQPVFSFVNEEDFMSKVVAQFPRTMSEIPRSLQNSVQTAMNEKVTEMKDAVNKTTIRINQGVQKTMDEVHKTLKKASEAVQSSTKSMADKFVEYFRKLNPFPNTYKTKYVSQIQ